MSEDIELQDMSEDHHQGEENIYATLSSSTPPNKTGPCSSTIVRYRCAVVFLGVLCALLAIIIRVLWLNTTSEANQIHTEHNDQLQLLRKICKNFTEVTSFDNTELQTNYCILSREKSLLQDQFNKLQTRIKITQDAVDVTLDPDTANNHLILSADGKQVKTGDTWQHRPDNPKRFDPVVIVLGKQGFSSGRFYYEVQVSGKTGWSLGVAKESINRKGKIPLGPTNGFWAILLRASQYRAAAGPDVTLSLKEKPERVGVFVDYGAGLVSFYDAGKWSLMYSYKGVSFREKIYPFFNPNTNDNGKNSAPLVITPVACLK